MPRNEVAIGLKKYSRHQKTILVHEELPIAGLVTSATNFMQTLHQRQQLLQLPHPLHVSLLNLVASSHHQQDNLNHTNAPQHL